MDILDGIKVVDVTAYAFVPSAGGVLAHWGADVIKVETPGAPDPMRAISEATYRHYGRGKRSIALNLASDEGRALLYELCRDADVFLTSYLAPTRRKLGIDVEDIRKINPDIVYARGSGHGPKGPDADRPGYDALSWWYRGSLGQTAMDMTGVEWPPTMVGHGDGMSGLVFAGGICAALLHRALKGEALVVDSSLMGTAVWFNGLAIMGAQFTHGRKEPRKQERPPLPAGTPKQFISAVRAIYQTGDYRFLNLLFLTDDDRDWQDLCQRIERPDLAADERFASRGGRAEHGEVLMGILEEVFYSRTLAEWKEALADARGAWAPVMAPEEMGGDPQVIANDYMTTVDYADGPLAVPAPGIMFDEEAGQAPPAPAFGEHTDAILSELGHDASQIARWRESGAVG
ncbi:MAG: CoA transferase [Sphingomonadaceae bacterium]